MKSETKRLVWKICYDFAVKQLPKFTKWTPAELRQSYPFHRLLFSDEAIVAARVERSVVTTMGKLLYPAIAKAIAEETYSDVHIDYEIDGFVNDAACNMIEQIVTELRAPRRRRLTPREPDHEAEISDIFNSKGGGDSSRAATADIYIGDFPTGPLFVELKSPLPNLDIAAESKRKILYFLTIMDRNEISGAKAFLGLTYNPYGTRERYAWSFTKRVMDMDSQVLIGDELWNMIGGPGTYLDLLEIVEDVHRHLTP